MWYLPDDRLVTSRAQLSPVGSIYGTARNVQKHYRKIDRRNKLTNSLKICVNNPVRDLAQGLTLSSNKVRLDAGCMTFTDLTHSYIKYPDLDQCDGITVTVVLPRWPDGSRKTTLWTFGRDGSHINGEVMCYLKEGKLRFFSYRDGYKHNIETPISAVDDDYNSVVITVVVNFSGEAIAYLNGVRDQTSSTATITPDLSKCVIGADIRDNEAASEISLFLLHNKALNESDVISINSNPYQVFME